MCESQVSRNRDRSKRRSKPRGIRLTTGLTADSSPRLLRDLSMVGDSKIALLRNADEFDTTSANRHLQQPDPLPPSPTTTERLGAKRLER